MVSPLTTTRLDSAQGGTSKQCPQPHDPECSHECPGRFYIGRYARQLPTTMPAPRYSIAVLSTEGWYGGTQTPRTLAGRAGNSWQYTYTGQAMDETRWMLDPA